MTQHGLAQDAMRVQGQGHAPFDERGATFAAACQRRRFSNAWGTSQDGRHAEAPAEG
jgi:hypothetical protein